MTFVAPAPALGFRAIQAFGRKRPAPRSRLLIADEDGARRALGSDVGLPVAAAAGTSLEHLARIALG